MSKVIAMGGGVLSKEQHSRLNDLAYFLLHFLAFFTLIGYFCNTYGLFSSSGLVNVVYALLDGVGPMGIVASLAFAWLCVRDRDRGRFSGAMVFSACIIGLSVAVSSMFNADYSLEGIVEEPAKTILVIVAACSAVDSSLILLRAINVRISQRRSTKGQNCGTMSFRSLLCIFLVICVAWAPLVVAFAPGTVAWDFTIQLNQYAGNEVVSTHHPILSTLLYGWIWSVGYFLGAPSLFVTLVQTIALAASLTFELFVMGKIGCSRGANIAAILFMCFFPLFPLYCQWLVKDVLFTASFVVFVSSYVWCVAKPDSFVGNKRILLVLLVSSIFVGLLRNNGLYIVLVSALVLAMFARDLRPNAKLCLLCAALALPLFNMSLVSIYNAELGSLKETLSLPFQQTARYAALHSEEASEAEILAIESCLGSYTELGSAYDPVIADPIKERYRELSSEYVAAYLAQGFREPLTYIDALLEGTYGYWGICATPTFFKYDQQTVMLSRQPGEGYQERYLSSDELRTAISDAVKASRQHFPMSLLFQVGFYSLVLIASLGLIANTSERHKALLMLCPVIVLLLTCLMSPLNGSIRYAFGLISAYPVLLLGVFSVRSRERLR